MLASEGKGLDSGGLGGEHVDWLIEVCEPSMRDRVQSRSEIPSGDEGQTRERLYSCAPEQNRSRKNELGLENGC